jgi:transcriptional regulator with XRE-family HTH domain
MNAADDIAEFLTSRRAKITPEQAGLPTYGKRRVPGLRREEVASLAGVSAEYYRRLKRGQVSGVSELVLEAPAQALQLDAAERRLSGRQPPRPAGPHRRALHAQRRVPCALGDAQRALSSTAAPASVSPPER